MSVEPALILAILVGIFHASLYVLIRGSAGGRLPIMIAASLLVLFFGLDAAIEEKVAVRCV